MSKYYRSEDHILLKNRVVAGPNIVCNTLRLIVRSEDRLDTRLGVKAPVMICSLYENHLAAIMLRPALA